MPDGKKTCIMSTVDSNAGRPGTMTNDSSSKRPGPGILRAVKDTVKDASERVLSAVVENDEGRRGEVDEDEDAVPFSSPFAGLIASPKAPEKMNGGGGGGAIESAAVGGIEAGFHDDAEQSKSQSQPQTLRELLGSCGTDLMPGRDGAGGSRKSLRMPSRTESVKFVRNLLPERLGDVRDEVNASVMRCVRPDGTGSGRGRGRGRGISRDGGRGGSSDRIGGGKNVDTSVDGSEDMTGSGGGGASTTSFHTLDSKEEQLEDEMHRLERMTSWNTLETTGTARTYSTAGTYGTMQSGGQKSRGTLDMLGLDDSDAPRSMVIRDDDGNEIPDVLQDLKSRRERGTRSGRNGNNKSSRRKKKAVQFEYPPISSLRECPRTDPKDRAGLFFTEEELEEIETDRVSCRMVDDIEVVAVPAVTLPASNTSKGDDGDNKMSKRKTRKMTLGANRRKKDPVLPSSSSCTDEAESLSLGSVSASRQGESVGAGAFLSRQTRSSLSGKRPNTPLPNNFVTNTEHNGVEDGSKRGGRGGQESGVADNSSASVGVRPSADNTNSRIAEADEEKSGPLLKGVQIYLRQRSTNEIRKTVN